MNYMILLDSVSYFEKDGMLSVLQMMLSRAAVDEGACSTVNSRSPLTSFQDAFNLGRIPGQNQVKTLG
jgi:hypothetical protein